MKQKTKSVLAAIAMVATPIAGLAGVGVGIWAFTQLPHPYINQWVDLVNQKYTPIVSQVTEDVIRQTLHLPPEQQVTDPIIQKFYCDKVTKTPEIFVEDFLYHENREITRDCNINRVRISDPTIRFSEEKNEYFLSFTWDQTINFKSGKHEGKSANWKVHFHNLTFVPKRNINSPWVLQFDLKNDVEWKATWTFNYCDGFGGDWWKEASGKELDHLTFENYIKDSFFYECNYDSWYLETLN